MSPRLLCWMGNSDAMTRPDPEADGWTDVTVTEVFPVGPTLPLTRAGPECLPCLRSATSNEFCQSHLISLSQQYMILLRSTIPHTIARTLALSPSTNSLSYMSAPVYRPRGGGGGRGRGRGGGGGPRPVKRKAPDTPGDATPAIPSGQMTPMVSAVVGATTQTRFADVQGISPELLASIPFEFCTEVSCCVRFR